MPESPASWNRRSVSRETPAAPTKIFVPYEDLGVGDRIDGVAGGGFAAARDAERRDREDEDDEWVSHGRTPCGPCAPLSIG